MLVLPQELLLCDKIIEKTYFPERERTKKKRIEGINVVNGRISGYVCGYVDGTFNGVIKGEINARVDSMEEKEGAKKLLAPPYMNADVHDDVTVSGEEG